MNLNNLPKNHIYMKHTNTIYVCDKDIMYTELEYFNKFHKNKLRKLKLDRVLKNNQN